MEKKWTAKPLHLQRLLSSSTSFESIHRSFHSRIQGSHTSPRFLESVAWNANPEIRRTLESTWESKGPTANDMFSLLKGFKDSLPALLFCCRSPSYVISSNAWMLWILHQCHLTASFFGVFRCYGWSMTHLMPGFGPHTPSHPRRFFSVFKKKWAFFSREMAELGGDRCQIVPFVKGHRSWTTSDFFLRNSMSEKMTIRGRLSRIGSWCSRFVGCFRTSEATFSVTLADSTTQRHDWHECGGWSKHCELLGCKKLPPEKLHSQATKSLGQWFLMVSWRWFSAISHDFGRLFSDIRGCRLQF